jgi:hypothetical protein
MDLPMPSSVIRWLQYDPGSRRLIVLFQTGRRYAYENVPPEIYSAFRIAPSRGAYFNAWIRDHYRYSCLERSA